jgi:hypothetical protein
MKKWQKKEAKRNHVIDKDARDYASDDEANPPTNCTRLQVPLFL